MPNVIKYTLIENGLDFLLSSLNGVPFDKSNLEEAKKKIKYSILHLSAALELFLKKRLEKESWVYIFQNMNEAEKNKYNDRDFKSVDLKTAIDRLERIVGVPFSDNDKKILLHFRGKRNKLEHYDFEDTIIALENDIINVVKIVVDFITNNLIDVITTKTEKELLETIKTKINVLGAHANELRGLAKKQLEHDYIKESDLVICPHCLEKFLLVSPQKYGAHYRCYYCNWTPNDYNGYKEIAKAYIWENIGNDYQIIKDGGVIPLYLCFNCNYETMVIENNVGHCFSCCEDFDIAWCDRCGEPMIEVVDGEIICNNCIEDVLNSH